MKLVIVKKYGLQRVTLPLTVSGDFWIYYTDINNVEKKLINVMAMDNSWIINSDVDVKIMINNSIVEKARLVEYGVYYLTGVENDNIFLYCIPDYVTAAIETDIVDNNQVVIGNTTNSNIFIENSGFPGESCVILDCQNKKWTIKASNNNFIYVNDKIVSTSVVNYGDVLFVAGVKIILMKGFVIVEARLSSVSFRGAVFAKRNSYRLDYNTISNEEDSVVELYGEDDYFSSSPRIRFGIEHIEVKIDAPPPMEKEDKKPLLYTIGPMITMALMSVVTGYIAVSGLINKTQTLTQSLPSLIMCGSMLLSMILWPLLSKRYDEKQKKKKESERQERYSNYLEKKKNAILANNRTNEQNLMANFISLAECKQIVDDKRKRLWERQIVDDDFLELRIGLGSCPTFVDVKSPDEHFTLEDDNLEQLVDKVVLETKEIANIPITASLVNKNKLAVIGVDNLVKSFIEGLLLQMITFHSYQNLKIVVLTNDKNKDKWEYIKSSPYCWSNDSSARFFATNSNELKEVAFNLEQQFHKRKYKDPDSFVANQNSDYRSYKPYYVIFTDDYKSVKDLEIIKNILSNEVNYGFSLVIMAPKLTNLPNECKDFLYIDKGSSAFFESEINSNTQKQFNADFNVDISLPPLFMKTSNIPLTLDEEDGNLPSVLKFLEMYDVGRVEQLNCTNRWAESDPSLSLQAPVGIDKNGSLFMLDLHEKFHGPHGLIAGMTGSGKSEFIITYILSLAVNYHPYEVSFVLIDYKGGGLAGVFHNKENNIKLPHLAGTITNLDTNEMNRSLASIKSELKKRQKMFNEARTKLGESSIDIYKYQKLFRSGQVDKPTPHLFIISDEFAELKAQQPEFMDQLISTARIGRSLGVHLILATQKPSGVVDDQIWSNSKFKVCLKVQDRNDSMDVIKCADAAELKNVGRFYLLVGYNEFFAQGQSAWCGAPYIPLDKPEKKVDNSIYFVDNVGNVLHKIDTSKKAVNEISKGEEVTNIMKYLIDVAKKENISIPQLWSDKIPEVIFTDELKQKYNYTALSKVINPVIGEYDDPNNQIRNLLTLPLSASGNTAIYGIAGSGKENLLSTLICSIATTYNPEELSLYLLDFGAESLKMFKDLPHVGDIVFSVDEEKVENLFKMIKEVIEIRKKILANYGGNFELYLQSENNTKLPYIIVVLNNIEAFNEAYEDYMDTLVQLTREGTKYGIIFVVTSSTTNAIRYTLLQNFKQILCLQFSDNDDYLSVVGKTDGVFPSRIKGRGILHINENVYEFQSAYPCDIDEMGQYVKSLTTSLREKYKYKADRIPILPETVDYDVVKSAINSIESVPIGIDKNTLHMWKYNFKSNYVSLVLTEDVSDIKVFVKSFITVISKVSDSRYLVIDAAELFEKDEIKESNYHNDRFPELIGKFMDNIKSIKGSEVNAVDGKHITCVIVGIANLINKLGSDLNFAEFIEENKEWKRLSFIFIDSVSSVSKLEYESWYKTTVNPNQGIWIGDGANNQSTIRITKNTRILNEDYSTEYGCVVLKGRPSIVKFIDLEDFHEGGEGNE